MFQARECSPHGLAASQESGPDLPTPRLALNLLPLGEGTGAARFYFGVRASGCSSGWIFWRAGEKGRQREGNAGKFIGSMGENLFRGNLSPLGGARGGRIMIAKECVKN